MEQKVFDLIIAENSQVIQHDPENASAYSERGKAFLDQGNIDLALSDFNKVIQLDANNAFVHTLRGMAYHKKGELTLAIADFNEAIQLEPGFQLAYFMRGQIYEEQGDYMLAIADFDKDIQLEPDNAVTHMIRGKIYADQGSYGLALSDFNKSIQLNPNNAIVYNFRGLIYGTIGEPDKAVTDFKHAMELDPDEAATCWFNIGLTYSDIKGKRDDAIAAFKRVLELSNEEEICRNAISELQELNAWQTTVEPIGVQSRTQGARTIDTDSPIVRTHTTERVCPQCLQSDKMQKVKSIVDSGTSTSEIYKTDSVLSQGYTTASTKLVERLQFPGDLARGRKILPLGCTLLFSFSVMVSGFVVGGMLFPYNETGLLITGGVFIVLGIYLMVAAIKTWRENRQAERERSQQAQNKNQTARSRWQNDLYYCFRDDCVFIPGKSRTVSPEQMHLLLYD